MTFNILVLNKRGDPIKFANMIPAIILPPLYMAMVSMV